ncbi:MAG: nicotinate-nucleotide adenylyltransferase [Proteobacteria bacterium]|nr:nicotinate-nucleotide adenylyltransferase [Pseudomonadota bacterium]
MRKSAPYRFGSLKARLPHAEPGQRIGLLGGSFNPPHAAHRLITEIALKRIGLDRVWWIVTPGNPLKSHRELLPLGERVRLARGLVRDPRVIVTEFEAALDSPFTAATLGHLKLRLPEVQFVWLMGADGLVSFDRWQQWQEIFKAVPIAVIDRPGWRLKALASRAAARFADRRWPEDRARLLPFGQPPCWSFLTGPMLKVSSTEIRAKAWNSKQFR